MDPAITRPKFEESAHDDHVGMVGNQRSLPTLEGVLNTLTRRRWLVIAVALLGTAAAVFAGSRITPKYTATALIELANDPANIPNLQIVQDVAGISAAGATAVLTTVQRLSSREHLGQIVEHLDLLDDPELNPPAVEDEHDLSRVMARAWQQLRDWGSEHWLAATVVADQIFTIPLAPFDDPDGSSFAQGSAPDNSVSDAPSQERVVDTETLHNTLVSRVASNLQVRQQGNSYAIGVSYTSADPQTAAAVANAVIDLYKEAQLRHNRDRATSASNWLSERVAALKWEVADAAGALERYRIANGLLSNQWTRVDDLQVADLSRELTTARADLSGLRARLELARKLRRQGQPLDTLLEVLSSPLIMDLRRQESELSRLEGELSTTLGPEHPRMLLLAAEKQKLSDKIGLEIQRILAQMENEESIATERASALAASLADARSGTSQIQAAEAGYRRLELAAEASQRHYERFLDRYYDAKEQEQIVGDGLQVISAATPPERPSTPGPALFAVMGFTLSSLAGVMLAFLLDRFDKGLRGDKEVRALLGAHRIGIIPKLSRRQRPPHRYLLSRPLSVYAEAIREVLTDCHVKAADRSPVIAITSSVPEEGKTTLSISLALCAALSKHRVVLLDLDLRRPAVLRALRRKPMSSGIVDYIVDGAPLANVVVHDRDLGFDIIPMGRSHVDPTSLLTSDRMTNLLADLRAAYDYIVVDSPPVLGITDVRLFVQRADTVVLVVQWGKTSHLLAQSSMKLLRRSGANIAGVVLTQANVKKHARYGYGDTGTFYKKYHGYYHG